MDITEFNKYLKYGGLASGSIIVGGANTGDAVQVAMKGDASIVAGGTVTFAQGLPFIATTSFGSASFGTGVSIGAGATILADSVVSGGRKVYPSNFWIKIEGVNSADGWNSTTMTSLGYNITDGSGGTFFSFGTPITRTREFGWGNIPVTDLSTGSMSFGSVAFGTAFYRGTGGAASKGLSIVSNGTVTGALGTMWVTVYGFIK